MMRFELNKDSYGRVLLVITTLLVWLLILVLFKTSGYEATWGLWRVPSVSPPFLDFRLIPGSAESFSHGYEPSIRNPYEPHRRLFNYPAFWRLFFYTGIKQSDTIWISVAMIVLFFVGVFLFPKNLSIAGAVVMLLVIFSPASMLLYARGNVDLIVFFICTLIVLVEDYSANIAALLIAFAAIVKMFPFFGITVLLRESKNKFWLLFGICSLVLALYMISTWSSVEAAWTTTMRSDKLSYGTNVLVSHYKPAISKVLQQWFAGRQTGRILRYGPSAVALFLLLFVGILSLLNAQQLETFNERSIAAFRMGASIYVGTFLLGNNFDYRLAFLILVVPQLVEWMRFKDKTFRTVAWMSVGLVLLSCWHLWILEISLASIFHSLADSTDVWMIFDEIMNWMLFGSLAYLLAASMPGWMKDPFLSFFPKRDTVPSIS